MKRIVFLLILFIPVLSFAQYDHRNGERHADEPSAISIFSENGEKFYLVLNGVNQNSLPVSRIRVEGLPQFGNDVQIMFPDNTPGIRKRINIADPVDGKAVDMTLKIVRGRDGYARLKFHRCTEAEHNYHATRDEYVMNYGNPKQINTVTETTYTDPYTGRQVTETTTTTTTTNNDNYPPPPPPPPPAPMPMSAATFNQVKQSISGASFDDTRLSTAKTILGSNYVTTDQVIELCGLFSFDNTKMAFAKFAYSKTVDQNNYFKVAEVFGFDADEKALNDFITGRH
jgi:hypothetical protein